MRFVEDILVKDLVPEIKGQKKIKNKESSGFPYVFYLCIPILKFTDKQYKKDPKNKPSSYRPLVDMICFFSGTTNNVFRV